MTNQEAIKRIEYLKNKAEIALINNNTSCEWLKKDVEGTITAFSTAIEAVEKQIPKKPILREQMGLFKLHLFHCPACDDELISEWNKNIANPYCHHCGQAIDWSDEE